jgi:hypothetical protein
MQGSQIYYGHEVLGLLALDRGNLQLAKFHLMESVRNVGKSPLTRFGPNMALAKALLDCGEKDVVLQFINICKGFWKDGLNTLLQWQGAIQAGAKPDFGRHLVFAP